METSSGWSLSNNPTSQTYHWIGDSGIDNDWDNPDNCELANGTSNGCIPIAVDNVVVDNDAVNGIRIPNGILASCNDFNWIKTTPATLLLDGTFLDDTDLHIKGDLFLHNSAIVTANGSYSMKLDASSNNEVETNAVNLPVVSFTGSGGQWKLKSNFISEGLNLVSGTISTLDYDIETDNFSLQEEHFKTINLGSSHVKVNGLFALKPFDVEDGIIVNAGTSFIECEELDILTVTLYDIQLNNNLDIDIGLTQSNPSFADDLLTAHRLILNGTGAVTSMADLNVDSLVFIQDDATLKVIPGEILTIYKDIISETSSANPASIESSDLGTHAQIEKPIGNLCVSGFVSFQDMNADMGGVFHSSLGTDNGNNTNINFSNSTILTPLYWIGNTGDWDTKSNWSNVSGGCPVNKDPNTAFQLIFDDYSFISPSDIITVPNLTNCKTLNFSNTLYPASLDIQTRLNPFQVFINDANVNFSGAKMYVQVKTVLNGDGNLTLNIIEGDTPKYDTPILELYDNSNVVVKPNTLLIVRE